MKFNYIIYIALSLLLMSSSLAAVELRDPTRPELFAAQTTDQPLTLNAILISPDRRLAIINGLYLKVDDQINENKVISIEPNVVRLTGPSGTITLYLLGKPIKQVSTEAIKDPK
jgi:hypothetical protein